MLPAPTNYVPLDNLYKFTAISGLVLIALTLYNISLAGIEFRKLRAETTMESALLNSELQIHSMPSNAKEPYSKEQYIAIARRIEENKVKMVALKQMEDSYKPGGTNAQFASTVFVLGFLLSAAGFALWYFRLQRFQDELLQLEVKQARQEANK